MVLRSDINGSVFSENPVQWEVASHPVPYDQAVAHMDAAVSTIAKGAAERVWLVQHPPVYTGGTSAKAADLLNANRFPVFSSGRGGQYTYHGPGQRVAYVMLNLKNRGNDVRAFVAALENWLIATLLELGVVGERREDRVGVWVRGDGFESKIAALGIRVRHGVTFHGISLNVSPDLSHYDGIVSCGVSDRGVTSLAALGVYASMAEVDGTLQRQFEAHFGPTMVMI